MGVSRSGFYAFLRRKKQPPDPAEAELLKCIANLAEASGYTYGSRRMTRELPKLGYRVGRHRVRRLMRQAGIEVRDPRRYRVTTNSEHRQPVFENHLKRQFEVEAPNRVWAGDITYIWTHEGWLYLAVVIDLYSRKVVGYAMRPRLTSTLACDALQMALWNRRPPKGLIHHSDRGVQYASHASSA